MPVNFPSLKNLALKLNIKVYRIPNNLTCSVYEMQNKIFI